MISSRLDFGLLTGNTSFLSENKKDSFQKASLTHVLAVSGEHFSYIIIVLGLILSKMKQKRLGQIITVIIVLTFAGITGYTGSVIRARNDGAISDISQCNS